MKPMIIPILLVAVIFLFSGCVQTLPEEQILTSCAKDSDCVIVGTDCCPCSSGGSQKAINRDYFLQWNSKIAEECSSETIACAQFYNCKADSAACENSKCVLVEREEIDLCENVVCEDSCQGTTLLSGGGCENGKCVFGEQTKNSKQCGYNPFGIETEAILRFCEYRPSFQTYTFLLSVKNTGEKAMVDGGSVWLVSPEIETKNYQPLNRDYDLGRFWWEEVSTSYPYKGRIFTVYNKPEFEDFGYEFIYCKLENNDLENCSQDNGLVLYSGSTGADCNITS